jgi:membrane-bound ClpP family serine protease
MDKWALNAGYAIMILGIILFLLNLCAVWQSAIIFQIICILFGNLLVFSARKLEKA